MKFKKKFLVLTLIIILILIISIALYFIISIKPELEIKLISPVNEILNTSKLNLKFLLNAKDDALKNCNFTFGAKFKEYFLLVKNKWDLFDDKNRNTAEGSAIFTYHNKIYQVGFGGADDNKKMIIYDIETNNWTTAAPYPYGLEGASFANYKNNFYVFGGSNTTTLHKSAYKYNPKEDKWVQIKDLPYPLRGSTSATIDNKLHMVGGTTGNFDNLEITNKHLVYDFEKEEYYFEKEFPHPIKFSTCGVIDNMLYILGGNRVSNNSNVYQEPSDEIYSYNIETKKWEFKTKLPQKITVSNRNSVVYDNKIFMFGGNNGYERISTVYAYNIITNKVEEIYPQIPYDVENTNTVLIKDKIYFFGGFCLYKHCFEEKYYLNLFEIENRGKPFLTKSVPLMIEPNKIEEYHLNLANNKKSEVSERELIFLWYISCVDKENNLYNSTISYFEIKN